MESGECHDRRSRPKPETEARYHVALQLYSSTTLPLSEICRQTHTSFGAFRSYIYRCHRDMLFARHGISVSPEEAASVNLRKPKGQTPAAHSKYKDAIHACEDAAYIEYNVSQIACIFHVDPTALSRQLRVHYPGILEQREIIRGRLGINDNLPRGMKPWCRDQYAKAVEHLRTTDDTIRQTAESFGLSYSGLREHILYYHKDLVRIREDKRKQAKAQKKPGALTGCGKRHEPSPEQMEKYRKAIELYRTTAMTQKEIAAAEGITVNGLRNYLRTWNRELIIERRRSICNKETEIDLSDTKHYLKSTAAKYEGAIKRLKESGLRTAEVAKEFGLNPETFRMYLHEHEPALAAGLGMTRLPNGKLVSARNAKKYEEAVNLYETTTEPLKSIAQRLGLQYNSVSGFIRRNCPEVTLKHKSLCQDNTES